MDGVLAQGRAVTIYALTVAKNEEHRYLRSFLDNVADWADQHFFYDDRSEDNTFKTALIHGRPNLTAALRSLDSPSFDQDEGMFRQAAWDSFERHCRPQEGDWVLVIDCDEMLVANHHLQPYLQEGTSAVAAALRSECDLVHGPVSLAFHEVFGWQDKTPLVRMDGFWGIGFAPRLFPYRPGARFAPGKVGVPAVPTYVMAESANWNGTDQISVMHFGYANAADHQVKFNRYKGQPNHHPKHIDSILGEKDLVLWWGGLIGEMKYGRDG